MTRKLPNLNAKLPSARDSNGPWLCRLSIVLTSCGFPKPADVVSDGGDGGSGVTCMQTTCTDGVLQVCDTSGMVRSAEHCPLGCFSDQSRCNDIEPSNGLGPALDQAAQEKPIELLDGAMVDSDSGAIFSALGTPLQVTSITVVQLGGARLRALLAQSWTINGLRIRGTSPIAFVATDEIRIHGVIDASADGDIGGPGGLTCDALNGGGGAPTTGFFIRTPPGSSPGYPAFLWISNGFGGGGFGTPGGAGGLTDLALGAADGGSVNGNAELIPLRGGCQGGGGAGSSSSAPPLHRGAGGGTGRSAGGEFRVRPQGGPRAAAAASRADRTP